jgi:hypothetical protein
MILNARRTSKLAGTLLLSGGLLLAATAAYGSDASTAGATGTNAAGNKGTVKIDGVALDGGSDNNPHQACRLDLEYFGFDTGTWTADVAWTAQSPSGSGAVPVLTGATHFTFAGSGNGNHLDHVEHYTLDLTGLTAQPHQGYHVKVQANTSQSSGSLNKFKTIWVGACAPASTSVSTSASTSVSTSASVSTSTSAAASGSASVSATTATHTSAPADPQVKPTKVTRDPQVKPTTKVLGVKTVRHLPRTGAPIQTAVVSALAMMLAGLVLLAAGARRSPATVRARRTGRHR